MKTFLIILIFVLVLVFVISVCFGGKDETIIELDEDEAEKIREKLNKRQDEDIHLDKED